MLSPPQAYIAYKGSPSSAYCVRRIGRVPGLVARRHITLWLRTLRMGRARRRLTIMIVVENKIQTRWLNNQILEMDNL